MHSLENASEYTKKHAIPALGYYPKEPISMGTTLIALEFADGVVVGTDSRTSTGSFIASRVTDKIAPITDHIVALRTGSAADTQAIADISHYYVEAHSIMEGAPISVNRVTQIFRDMLYNYREQMMAGIIIAGYDAKEGGQIYAIPLGGFITREHFTSSGSGSSIVMGYMDKTWRPNMTLDEVKDMVKTSVGLATMRDGSSGGVIRLAIITKNGTERQLIRPDGNDFPTILKPKAYKSFPSHLYDNENPTEVN